ncbi:hypothetical protein ACFUTX_14330 [Microbacterium sp. NPDC057407]|uniref:hypothetical protein n=1 Tax=Microbacterium sp. NPDC057407 TaxID=3346120 RepID=UPI0036721A5D
MKPEKRWSKQPLAGPGRPRLRAGASSVKKRSALKRLEWNANLCAIAGVVIIALAIVLMITDPISAAGIMPAIPFFLAILGLVALLSGLFGVMLLLHAQALVEGVPTGTLNADRSEHPQ